MSIVVGTSRAVGSSYHVSLCTASRGSAPLQHQHRLSSRSSRSLILNTARFHSTRYVHGGPPIAPTSSTTTSPRRFYRSFSTTTAAPATSGANSSGSRGNSNTGQQQQQNSSQNTRRQRFKDFFSQNWKPFLAIFGGSGLGLGLFEYGTAKTYAELEKSFKKPPYNMEWDPSVGVSRSVGRIVPGQKTEFFLPPLRRYREGHCPRRTTWRGCPR